MTTATLIWETPVYPVAFLRATITSGMYKVGDTSGYSITSGMYKMGSTVSPPLLDVPATRVRSDFRGGKFVAIVEGLEANTSYRFGVVARLFIDEDTDIMAPTRLMSRATDKVVTLSGPPTAPRLLRVGVTEEGLTILAPRSLLLMWDAPNSDGGALVTSYEVQIRRVVPGEGEPFEENTGFTAAAIEDIGGFLQTKVVELEAASSYLIRVATGNESTSALAGIP
jgi:hypothetical protein